MKTIDEQIKEIKHCGECAIYGMDNHKVLYLPDDGSFNDVINSMHNAQSKEKLSEAYYKYINLGICNGYSDGEIIGGIMQNEAQNKKFDVNIESVIKSLIDIKYSSVNLSKPVENTSKVVKVANSATESIKNKVTENTNVEVSKSNKASDPVIEPKKDANESAGGVVIDDKIVSKIRKKMQFIESLADKITNNQSTNPIHDAEKASVICDEVNKLVASINPEGCTEEDIAELNDATTSIKEMKEYFEALKIIYKHPSNKQNNPRPVEQTKPATTNNQSNNSENQNVMHVQKVTPVQQTMAAHTEGGFNISNFIKPEVKPNHVCGDGCNGHQHNKPFAFPHQICGLTNEQIVAEVGKHFKVIQTLPAYALYDLINNKLLARRMKELDAKHRPNNPFLTQVNINEYIGEPELLAKFPLCFTMPCNDKAYLIMVLFNPNPVLNKNGVPEYPIHIFKAKKTTNNNK